MKHSYLTPSGQVCAPKIEFELDENKIVHNVRFFGGCTGNRNGISKLVEGMHADEVIEKLSGITCRSGTSCPDQLAKALKKVLANG